MICRYFYNELEERGVEGVDEVGGSESSRLDAGKETVHKLYFTARTLEMLLHIDQLLRHCCGATLATTKPFYM